MDEDGAVDGLHQGMNRPLGMDDDIDLVVGEAEQKVRFDDLEPLVHQCRRVHGDLRPHGPHRMGQRLLHIHVTEIFPGAAPERSPAPRDERPAYLIGWDAVEQLPQG